MSRGSVAQPRPTDARLAQARVRFLTTEAIEPGQVRDTILASWWRSRRSNVAADRIKLSFVNEPDNDTPLIRSAAPVLSKLSDNLDGQPISVILTDAHGVVLSRLTADHDLERHLDGVLLVPGFSYAEGSVGTNGIGTALESGQATHVFGHEHYAEHLEDLACAGVPIRHPVSGKIIGAMDLTCWRKDADALLVALARTTADQINRALLASTGAREFELLEEYLRADRRTAGIVLAINNDMVMMNDYARNVLDATDQVALLGHAADALTSPHPGPVDVELPSGAKARMHCRPLPGHDQRPRGGVVSVKLIELVSKLSAEPVHRTRRFLPGLVGSGTLWLRSCHQVDAAHTSGEWLALEGEPGVGKLAVLQAVHRLRNPARIFHVLDAADANDHDWRRISTELLDTDGSLVIRHIDQASPRRVAALRTMLEESLARGDHPNRWVVVTLGQNPADGELADFLQLFPRTVELPPLRHHIEDLHELVPFFLAKLSHSGPLACSPEAMQLLIRSSWPGNTEQLWRVLRSVMHHRRTGTIYPVDLPPECWTVSRRLLGPLESMERDAIVKSLLDFDGNKVKAAKSLGMSRATIYRKIHEYGIVAPSG